MGSDTLHGVHSAVASNAVAERFFSTLEFELLLKHDWETREDARRAIFRTSRLGTTRVHQIGSIPNAERPVRGLSHGAFWLSPIGRELAYGFIGSTARR